VPVVDRALTRELKRQSARQSRAHYSAPRTGAGMPPVRVSPVLVR
jgi:hypothetical protein